jgi:hypothetical protein
MKRIVVVVVSVLIAVLIGAYFFYKRNIIKYEMVYEIPNSKEEFRPQAYVFFHSDKDLERYFRRNSTTKQIGIKTSSVKFDFNKYSYCIVFGKKITNMEYSQKQIYFDDPTPTYARTKGKIPVFVKYENGESATNGIFIYRIAKDERLRGFYD